MKISVKDLIAKANQLGETEKYAVYYEATKETVIEVETDFRSMDEIESSDDLLAITVDFYTSWCEQCSHPVWGCNGCPAYGWVSVQEDDEMDADNE